MADLKISQFVDGGAIQSTDEIATSRAGINTKVFVGSAAALDASGGVGDVVVLQDDGSGNPQYPPFGGSQIFDIDASNVIYSPESGTIITAINVQDAITELDAILGTKLDDITGLITVESGSDITITGSGTVLDPYVLDSTGGGGDFLEKDEPVITANITGTYDIDFSQGQVWDLTATGDCDIDIINPPSGSGGVVVRFIQNATAGWSISYLMDIEGNVPQIPGAAGDYIDVVIYTLNGGTTWTVKEVITVEA